MAFFLKSKNSTKWLCARCVSFSPLLIPFEMPQQAVRLTKNSTVFHFNLKIETKLSPKVAITFPRLSSFPCECCGLADSYFPLNCHFLGFLLNLICLFVQTKLFACVSLNRSPYLHYNTFDLNKQNGEEKNGNRKLCKQKYSWNMKYWKSIVNFCKSDQIEMKYSFRAFLFGLNHPLASYILRWMKWFSKCVSEMVFKFKQW